MPVVTNERPLGFNPMRWNCERDGCFNKKVRPKIEVFADCFPRKINFGDVDGLVELQGMFCLLEWKGEGGVVSFGQRYSYEQFTKQLGNVVFVINGNAETMEVSSYFVFWAGRKGLFKQPASLDDVKNKMRIWANWASRHYEFDYIINIAEQRYQPPRDEDFE